jgi:hypothetical protein
MMVDRRARLLLALVAAGLLPAQPSRRIQPYVAESKLFAVYKPADWHVKEEPRKESFRIVVTSPDGGSRVDFFWARNTEGRANALWFVGAFREMLGLSYPDVALSEVFVSRDSARAMATVRYSAEGRRVKGRYYFESRPAGLSAQGYTAPETRLAAERGLMLNIMASLAFTRAEPRGQAQFQPRFVELPLVARQAEDRSLSMQAPADWTFLAGGGKVVTFSPDAAMGFLFTTFQGNPMVRAGVQQGIIPSRYLPPGQALGAILTGFGHRNYRVLQARPDVATNQQFPLYTKSRCDAQDLVVSWTSNKGVACVGAFKMVNALPSMTGLWYTITAGIWGPEKEFYSYYPALERIANSFSINDRFARDYIRAGLENLRRLQQQTMAAMRDLNRAREQNQADWEARQRRQDYMQSKWDDYRRGNSYWVSDLEGGKVYHTDTWGTRDTETGDYYEGGRYTWTNFEGQNPRHPGEDMREVSSYEVEHGRRPQ